MKFLFKTFGSNGKKYLPLHPANNGKRIVLCSIFFLSLGFQSLNSIGFPELLNQKKD